MPADKGSGEARPARRLRSGPRAHGSVAEGRWQRVYAMVALVPPGRVATYGQIAALAGLGRGARQVGYALHALPPYTAVPWQRVINSRGEISLRRAGGGDTTQRILLEQEGVRFDSRGRVDLEEFGWDGPGGRRVRSPRTRTGQAQSDDGAPAGRSR
jgi:methylated-DNA-protein-cysteine methyltransferase-like protein